jgi:hypothetical protein
MNVQCESCGDEAIHYLVCDNIGRDNKTPMCVNCSNQHEQIAQETNDHEIRHFGGAYGLVTFHYEPLSELTEAS